MSQLPKTRQSLLIRLRERSQDAWSEFLEIYEQAIIDYARRRGLQDADARDVTQEVLAAVDKKIEQWQDDPKLGKFRGWLFRVARNIAVDKVTQQSRRAAASGDTMVNQMLAEQPGSADNESTVFWTEYRRTLLNWAADQVKPEIKETSWQSFVMTAVEGQKPEAVAEQLGISVGSVYAAKFRIVTRIRKIVSRFDDTENIEDDLLNQIRKND
jgi:RNA polymerase sigma-70 factor (ECF subfamily)